MFRQLVVEAMAQRPPVSNLDADIDSRRTGPVARTCHKPSDVPFLGHVVFRDRW